jgi:hypothetical protein
MMEFIPLRNWLLDIQTELFDTADYTHKPIFWQLFATRHGEAQITNISKYTNYELSQISEFAN